MTSLDALVPALQSKFGPAILGVSEFRGETTISVVPEHVAAVLRELHSQHNFIWLSDLTAYDDFPQEPRFQVCYQLCDLSLPQDVRIKAAVSGEAPELESITAIYPAANWQERELYDMFGITFRGHPDLRRILMPADWEGHPLRRDYPLGYEEIQFTFNFDEIDKKKPYAKE